MASKFKGRLSVDVHAIEWFDSVLEQGAIRIGPEAINLVFSNGTSTGDIDLAWGERKTSVGASVTTVYDLAGSLTDHSAATISFAKITTIAIRNRSTTAANYLEMGPDATNGFGVVASNVGFFADASDRVIVPADYNSSDGDGSWIILHCRTGVAVSAGSTDELAVITQGGTSGNTWDIVFMGRSA